MEISDSIKKGLEIVQVSRMDEVLARAMPEFTWDKRIVWRGARSIMNTNHALISMVQTAFVYMSAVRQRLAELGQEIPPREQQTPKRSPTLAMKALSVHSFFQLRLQPRHGGLALRQRRPLEQRTIHMNIVPGHARGGKPLLESLPHRAPIERERLGQHPDRLVHGADDQAGDAVVDDLGHGTATEGENRRAAGHGLDHRQSERLQPVDGE